MALRIGKKCHEHSDPTAFNGRTREDRDARGLQGIGSSNRLSHPKERTGPVSIRGGRKRGLLPDVFKDLRDFTQNGNEGDDPHWLPSLQTKGLAS